MRILRVIVKCGMEELRDKNNGEERKGMKESVVEGNWMK